MGRLSRRGRRIALTELLAQLVARWGPAPTRDLDTVVLDGQALVDTTDQIWALIEAGELTHADALIRHLVHLGARPNELFRLGGPAPQASP